MFIYLFIYFDENFDYVVGYIRGNYFFVLNK